MSRARSALGLRGRIVGVVLLTAVAALAVAAIALLGPLEHSLRKAEVQSLIKSTDHAARPFARLPLCTVITNPAGEQAALGRAESRLGRQLGVIAVVLANPGRDGQGATVLPRTGGDDVADLTDDSFSDVATAFRTGEPYSSTASIHGTEYARRVIPFTKLCHYGGGAPIRVPYVLAIRKSIAEIPVVARVVRNAFLDAALAALGLTLLLGIPLSFRLVRRLRRLREVAVEVEHDAPMLVPVDTANDEVGDLARALAAMQLRISQQEEARRAFVATASHELRTPLTSLSGMLELLGEGLGDAEPDIEDARDLLGRAQAQSQRLRQLAADLLDLSRIDAQVQLRSEAVELGELSRAVVAEFEHATAEGRIQIRTTGEPGEAVWALGDPGSVARIVRILLDNATRASPPGSPITVVLSSGADTWISVADEGPGVPADERESIFNRFSRGKDTAGQAGFGLGLAIGRELAQRMGGDLVLEPDRADGHGATFTVHLPRAHAPGVEAEPLATT